MSSSIWLHFDDILFKRISFQPNDGSFVENLVQSLSLNDSNQWLDLPGLPFALNFEANVDGNNQVLWFRRFWHVSLYISFLYILLIYFGIQWMKTRKPFNLRGPLSVWSGGLAIFSIIGAIRCLPEFVDVLYNEGFIESFCRNSYKNDKRLIFWYLIFIWSKVAELGDTAFIILRKQKLINLHWIHHVLTLCYCFFVFKEQPGTARWMVGMNFAIHSLMYSYYALRALQYRIPRIISMIITFGQITQMVFGFIINYISFERNITGVPCDMTLASASTGLALYSIFFLMFLNFFIKAYLFRPQVNRIVFFNNNEKKIQ